MTSPQKLKANRENARRSTGPKSVAGKTRSARNAHRHGLAVPIWADEKLAAQAQALAHEIAGAGASIQTMTLARGIAEAQVELCRVRQVRQDLLARALSPAGLSSSAETTRPILSDLIAELVAIDRYERRALSRRKNAIRVFDAARHRQVTRGDPAELSHH